jgi:hypothetical protein
VRVMLARVQTPLEDRTQTGGRVMAAKAKAKAKPAPEVEDQDTEEDQPAEDESQDDDVQPEPEDDGGDKDQGPSDLDVSVKKDFIQVRVARDGMAADSLHRVADMVDAWDD